MSVHFQFDVGGSETIAVNVPDRQTLSSLVEERLKTKHGFALATINLDHLVKLRKSESFRESYSAQDLVVADGNPIVWLSRVANRPVGLAPGSELIEPLARIAADRNTPIALVGSTPETLAEAAKVLADRIPGLRIVAKLSPSRNFDPHGEEAEKILQDLRKSGAGLTFLALGAPRQETFAARGRSVVPEMGFVSIGAGLDFLAGSQVRAPAWVRRIAMEWLWRMLSNPRRLAGRYLNCAFLIPRLAVMAFRQRGVDV